MVKKKAFCFFSLNALTKCSSSTEYQEINNVISMMISESKSSAECTEPIQMMCVMI